MLFYYIFGKFAHIVPNLRGMGKISPILFFLAPSSSTYGFGAIIVLSLNFVCAP